MCWKGVAHLEVLSKKKNLGNQKYMPQICIEKCIVKWTICDFILLNPISAFVIQDLEKQFKKNASI